jgi:hypothetical protein
LGRLVAAAHKVTEARVRRRLLSRREGLWEKEEIEKLDLFHCGEVLILCRSRRRRSRASMASGRSGGVGLATELLPGKVEDDGFASVSNRYLADSLVDW